MAPTVRLLWLVRGLVRQVATLGVVTACGLYPVVMARIRRFVASHSSARPHPTEVDCGWQVLGAPANITYVQLSTYGSDGRQSEPKVSQTIQLDQAAAQELVTILANAFPDLRLRVDAGSPPR